MCNILTKEDVEMTVELDVRLEDETVWLTQAQMSQLLSKSIQLPIVTEGRFFCYMKHIVPDTLFLRI